ncbi:hypothetical protein E2C01_013991 [Portunus trituberculatus]|uniref:Uncharacterized protein n=1 Tax=Portunus trituberculatus TaxID=210409 RepID=A0A5B7DI03_PORTR|nr:hypothetical protein [Portunus trituberculatus]
MQVSWRDYWTVRIVKAVQWMWITDGHQTGISRYSASVYRAFSKVLYNMISYDLSTNVAAEVLELCP